MQDPETAATGTTTSKAAQGPYAALGISAPGNYGLSSEDDDDDESEVGAAQSAARAQRSGAATRCRHCRLAPSDGQTNTLWGRCRCG